MCREEQAVGGSLHTERTMTEAPMCGDGSLHTARFSRFSPNPHCTALVVLSASTDRTGASPLQPVAHPRAAHAHDCDLPDLLLLLLVLLLLLLLLLLPCSFALKLVQVEPPAPSTISEGAPSVESESRDSQQAAPPNQHPTN